MKNRSLILIIIGWLMTVVIGSHYHSELKKSLEYISFLEKRLELACKFPATCQECKKPVDPDPDPGTHAGAGPATSLYYTARSYIEKKDGLEGAQEFSDAVERNIVPFIDDLAPIVAAIRYAENGGPGREYGVMSDYAWNKTYSKQVGDCAKTVGNHYHLRWSVNSEYQQPVAVLKKNISALKLGITIIEGEVYPDKWGSGIRLKKKIKVFYEHLLDNVGRLEDIELFMISLSDWYCKVGAGNDPCGMNAHWLYNVWTYDRKIRDLSK